MLGKKRFRIFIVLIFSKAAIFGIPGANSLSLAQTDGKEIDRLFEKAGIRYLPDRTPPVEFNLPDPEGRIVSISEFRGKIVFLNFWTTWCFACRIEMPAMEKLHKRYRDEDFVMVAINLQEPKERVRQFFKDNKLTFKTLLDIEGIVGTEFGIRSIPTTFILDKQGRIIGKALGPREWDSKEARALFEYLIKAVK